MTHLKLYKVLLIGHKSAVWGIVQFTGSLWKHNQFFVWTDETYLFWIILNFLLELFIEGYKLVFLTLVRLGLGRWSSCCLKFQKKKINCAWLSHRSFGNVSIYLPFFGANDRIILFLSVVFKMFLLAYTSFLCNVMLHHDSPGSSFSCFVTFLGWTRTLPSPELSS